MKIRSKVRAGGSNLNHNAKKPRIKIKSKVRSGGSNLNHNAR
jgi:hypothetical protein